MAVRIMRGGTTEQPEMEVSHVGRVLELREMNGYHDSDFYALVWNDATGRIERVEYATTRGWTYNNGASIDADDETLAKVLAFKTEVYVSDLAANFAARMERVERGRTVTLNRNVKSRKNGAFTKGETGQVFWLGPDSYGRGDRAGVEFPDGRKHFFATEDLRGVADDVFDMEAAREYAECQAERYVADVRRMRDRKGL